MKKEINRRGFVQAALVLTGAVATGEMWLNWLNHEQAPSVLLGILKTHLGLEEKHAALMPAFLQRLKTPGLHTETPAQLSAWLQDPKHMPELSAYVVEEFLVGSNYFAVQNGEADELAILPIETEDHLNTQHLV